MDLLRVFGGIYALLEIFARLLHQIFLISSAISHYSFDILWYQYMFHPFVFLFIFQSDGELLYYFLDNLQMHMMLDERRQGLYVGY